MMLLRWQHHNSSPEPRSDPVCIPCAQPTIRCHWFFCMCFITHHAWAKALSNQWPQASYVQTTRRTTTRASTQPGLILTIRTVGFSSPFVGLRMRMNLWTWWEMPQHDTMQQMTRSQVAKRDIHADAAMPSHTTSDQYGSQGDVPTKLLPWAWTQGILKMRYLMKPTWMIIDQIYSSLIYLTPKWFQMSIYGISVQFSWTWG